MEFLSTGCALCTVGVALVSASVTYYRYRYRVSQQQQLTNKRPKAGEKQPKKFVVPKWALEKFRESEPSRLTKEQLQSLHKRKPPDVWNNVLIFPDPLHMSKREESSTKQLVRYFMEARTSIYVCMYLCSNYILSNAVRDKYDEGLIVNVVSEYDTWTAHNSKGIKYLAHHGIDVRLNKNGYMMHNKFVIIDEEAVITGSLNWTRQGVESNCENVVVTIDPRIVSKYLREFNKLFHSCRSWALEVNE